jgi:predicted alpha/beta-hydrolase family hydrolase
MNHLILSHGQESGPNATKVTRLDEIATAQGYFCQRPDYGTQASASERIAKLGALCAQVQTPNRLVLAGSSMGAYISAMCSLQAPVAGLFLLAPPIFFAGLEPAMRIRCKHVTIVHGWRDALIDPSEVIAFARAYGAKLVLVNDDHRLKNSIHALAHEFNLFLTELDALAACDNAVQGQS